MTIADEIRVRYRVKLNASYLSKMERGKVAIPLKTLLALADYFSVHPGLWIDPVPDGATEDFRFLYSNQRLMNSMLELQEIVGDDESGEMLLTYIQQLIKTLGQHRSGRPMKAARSPRNWTEKP